MKIAVDGPAEMLSYELGSFEIQLEPADQVDVECVQIAEKRFQTQPAPARDAAAQPLAATLVTQVVQGDAIVLVGHFDRHRVGGSAVESGNELPRRLSEITPNFEDRHKFPIGRKRRVERTERVGDATPFFDGSVARVATVDHVPDKAAHDANPLFPRHQSPARIIKLKFTERLHFERGDGADDTRGERK